MIKYKTVQPKSGINFVLYNNVLDVVEKNTGYLPVEDHINAIQILATDQLIMKESGILEIFVNNDAQTPVYYDNLRVTHSATPVMEVNAYYPYGKILKGLSISNTYAPNMLKYNAKELITAMELDWLDYGARVLFTYDLPILPTPDPLAEMYYSISPYAYCLNNPIKFIDPNGEDVYMYFYVAKDEEDNSKDARMFWYAAITRALDMLQNGQIKDGDVHTTRTISDLGKLGDAVDEVVQDLSPYFGQTAEFGLWSHGALDGPRGLTAITGNYALDGRFMTPEGWGNINFNWKEEGSRAMFYGCRTAASVDDKGSAVIPWAQTISMNDNMQNVEVWGQSTRSWPSTDPKYVISPSGAHSYPTYMIGAGYGRASNSVPDFINGVYRTLGISYHKYPMRKYINGASVR